ncbi:bola-like protein [Hymenopellis radicata]|nr:bola-like protein [Hymenopellis radicata]
MLPFTRRLFPVARQLRLYSTQPAAAVNLLEGEQNIIAKLTEKFSPTQLQVQDVSGGCGSFYAITIASEAFKGLTTLKQHRLVTETLKKEIEGIHGLQIKTTAV